jgi:ABC-2 type transport system permease protein
LKKCVADAQWLFVSCAAAMFAFCWLRVWVVSLLDTSRFKAILDLLPSEWQRFTPVDFEWLITYAGRISLGYDELIVVVCIWVWAIARGSDCVSGEVGRGTMEMLLAQPLSRLGLLLTQSSVTVCGVALLSLTAWLGTYVGIQTSSVKEEVRPTWDLPIPLPLVGSEIPIPLSAPDVRWVPLSEKVAPVLFWPATANLFALGMMTAGFTTLMSSWDRYRWRTIGIVMGVYVVQLLIKIAGLASEDLSWLLYLSAFTAYEPEAFVRIADTAADSTWSLFLYDANGLWADYGPLWYHLVMVLIGAACYLLAAIVFCRRDLPAPL